MTNNIRSTARGNQPSTSGDQPPREQLRKITHPNLGPGNKFWVFLIIVGVIVAGLMIYYVYTGYQGAEPNEAAQEKQAIESRTAAIIISELEGIQTIFTEYYENEGQYPVKITPVSLVEMASEVSGLEGYDAVRLKGVDGKDFMYQSDEAGSKYVIFAAIQGGSEEIKTSAPAGFDMPSGYNYFVASK